MSWGLAPTLAMNPTGQQRGYACYWPAGYRRQTRLR